MRMFIDSSFINNLSFFENFFENDIKIIMFNKDEMRNNDNKDFDYDHKIYLFKSNMSEIPYLKLKEYDVLDFKINNNPKNNLKIENIDNIFKIFFTLKNMFTSKTYLYYSDSNEIYSLIKEYSHKNKVNSSHKIIKDIVTYLIKYIGKNRKNKSPVAFIEEMLEDNKKVNKLVSEIKELFFKTLEDYFKEENYSSEEKLKKLESYLANDGQSIKVLYDYLKYPPNKSNKIKYEEEKLYRELINNIRGFCNNPDKINLFTNLFLEDERKFIKNSLPRLSSTSMNKVLIQYFYRKYLENNINFILMTEDFNFNHIFEYLLNHKNDKDIDYLKSYLDLYYLALKQENLDENDIERFEISKNYFSEKDFNRKNLVNNEFYFILELLLLTVEEYIILKFVEENFSSRLNKLILNYIKFLKKAEKIGIIDRIYKFFLLSDFKTIILYKYLFLKNISSFFKESNKNEKNSSKINRINSILRGENIGVKELINIIEKNNKSEENNKIFEYFNKYKFYLNDNIKFYYKKGFTFPIYDIQENNLYNIHKGYYLQDKQIKNIIFYKRREELIYNDLYIIKIKDIDNHNKEILLVAKYLEKNLDINKLIFQLIGEYIEEPKSIILLESKDVLGRVKLIEFEDEEPKKF